MLKFVLPGYYTWISRLKAPWAVVSWLVMYPIAAGVGALYFGERSICCRVVVYIFSFIAALSTYELGYIGNDYAAMTGERDGGTQRLVRSDTSVLKHNYRRIFIYKSATSISFCVASGFAAVLLGVNATIGVFAAWLVMLYLIFMVHNYVRSRWSIATFMMLSSVKYIVFIFIFPVRSMERMATLIVTEIVLIPLLRTIEYSTKERFHLRWCKVLVGDLDWFRVKYYIAVLGICATLYALHQEYVELLLVLSASMLIFRVATLVLAVKLKLRNKALSGVSIADQQGIS